MDPSLKVYGLSNVRVIDAGVIPLTVGTAIQQTVYMIAEKVRSHKILPPKNPYPWHTQGADIIKQDLGIL